MKKAILAGINDNSMNTALVNEDYSEYCAKGSACSAGYTDLHTGVSLFTVRFTPALKNNGPRIVFVPGLASVIDNFKDVLKELTLSHEVLYFETREKKTALISNSHGFTVSEIASDISNVINQCVSIEDDYVLTGYSLGATAIAEAYAELENKPAGIVLLEPNMAFNFPWWAVLLARGAKYLFRPLKPFLKWYIRKFRVNTTDDIEMYNINCRILDAAEPSRLGKTIRALKLYNTGDHLPGITVPALVIGASRDKFHSHDEALRFSELIPGCRYLDMVDNKRTHSAEAASTMINFIKETCAVVMN